MTKQEHDQIERREAFETAKRELLEAWGRAEREEQASAVRRDGQPSNK